MGSPYYDASGPSGQVNTVVGGTGIAVDSSDPVNPIVNATGVAANAQVFETTVGAGKLHADIEAANTAFQATGLPKAIFYIFGTVLVGSVTQVIKQSIDFVGVDNSPLIDLDQDINSGSGGDTEESLYRFIGVHVQSNSTKRIAQTRANQRYEFLDCILEMTGTASIALWSLDIFAPGQVVCRNCEFRDNLGSATDTWFLNASGSTLKVYLHACIEGATPASSLVRNQSGTMEVYFLDGTQIREFLLTESAASTANLFQDGSSTFNVSKASGITTVNLNRMGSASFSGSYTGDGTESQVISGWAFDTRKVKIWRREIVDGEGAVLWESTPEIVDDNVAGGSIFQENGTVEFLTNSIIALGFGSFTVDDNADDRDPNATGIVYNFLAEG